MTQQYFYSIKELVDNARATWIFRMVRIVFSVRCKFTLSEWKIICAKEDFDKKVGAKSP